MQTEQMKTNGTNGHALVRPELVALDVDLIDAHPNNPRKTFTEIDELAASITTHGVLEPIMVRPKGKRYELVFGERRWRATKKAKLPTILSLVRVLDDEQCEEIMVVENTKRSDLHPLEEAEGYERLHKIHGKSVDEIAAKVNKSPAQIYARMKLCALGKKAREAFYAGELDASKALLIARIPHEDLQLEALKAIGEKKTWLEDLTLNRDDRQITVPISYREAFHIVQSRYMLRLADAPFDRASSTLTKAGACTACPKRTGNQKELFADVKSADVCTDPKCYREKLDAHWAEIKAAAKDTGNKVVSEKGELFDASGHLSYNSGYEDLDSTKYDSKTGRQKKVRDLVGKQKGVEIVFARDKQGGIHELVKKAAVTQAERKVSPAEKKKRAEEKEQRKKENAKLAIEERCDELAIAAMVEKAEGKLPTADFWRAMVVAFVDAYESDFETLEAVFVARKLVKEDAYINGEDAAKIISKLSEKTCRALLVELVARIGASKKYEVRSAYDMLCDFYKVDPKKFQAEAKASVGGATS